MRITNEIDHTPDNGFKNTFVLRHMCVPKNDRLLPSEIIAG